jgi:hypothetical protein
MHLHRDGTEICALTINTLPDAMNTSAWGPPAWRLLHGLAALVPARRADATAARELHAWHACIRALRACLPCVYCRESFGYVSRPLPRENVDVWWWYVHELVNIKLKKRRVSFERARARLAPFVDADDVWLLLGAMSCNTDNAAQDAGTTYQSKRRGLCAFIRALRELLQLAAARQPRLGGLASTLALVCRQWSGNTQSPLLKTLADVRSHTVPAPRTQAFVARVKRMCVR